MQKLGCVLMISGWAIVVSALGLLASLGQRFGFVGAGVAVELLGLGLMAHHYREIERGQQ